MMDHFSRAITLTSLFLTSAAILFSQRSNLVPVSYQYEKTENSVTRVFPVSEYLESVQRGGVINAFPWRPCCMGFFSWSFPELSVKSTNSTRQAAYFSELIVNVSKSERNDEPVLLLEVGFEGRVSLINEGWGAVVDPALQFDMTISPGGFREATTHLTKPVTISDRMKLTNFDSGSTLDFSRFLPEPFRPPQDRSDYEELSGLVKGTLFYKNAKGAARQLSIMSPVNFGPPPAPFFPPSPVIYDVRLLAGVAPAVMRVPISQVVNAGGADHFLVRVGSDQSGHFEFRVTVRAVDGKTFSGGSFVVDTFVPRSGAKNAKLANSAGHAKDATKN